LYDEVPFFRQVFAGTIKYRWRRRNGEEGEHEFHRRVGRIGLRGYGRHFPVESYVERRISNLDAYAIDAAAAINRAVALGRQGITFYVDPKPRRALFQPMRPPG
jgi:aminoglycoside 3-N-acetyltransferase